MNKRKRKMLLVLPLLVIPLLTLAFWAMGGGGKSDDDVKAEGLNPLLPDANLKEEVMDKLGFYAKADKDSMKLKEWMQADPYYRKEFTEVIEDEVNENAEDKLMKRINELQSSINENAIPVEQERQHRRMREFPGNQNKQQPAAEEDPEIKQLEETLDKILDIQHPELVRKRLYENIDEGILLVNTASSSDTLADGFYGVKKEERKEHQNAIQAVIHQNQELVNGSVVKLRLVNEIIAGDVSIPKGNFIYGTVSLNNERLNIEITSIRFSNVVLPVKLQVYDMDGLTGLYIPGAITRDVAKQSADNSLQLLDVNTVDPSLKAQATIAGIGAMKNLISKKVKLVKVYVKAGYKVLLQSKQINL